MIPNCVLWAGAVPVFHQSNLQCSACVLHPHWRGTISVRPLPCLPFALHILRTSRDPPLQGDLPCQRGFRCSVHLRISTCMCSQRKIAHSMSTHHKFTAGPTRHTGGSHVTKENHTPHREITQRNIREPPEKHRAENHTANNHTAANENRRAEAHTPETHRAERDIL